MYKTKLYVVTWRCFAYSYYIISHHTCRGDTFQREVANLGEVRSLLSHDVSIMALTATATQTSHVLGMMKPIVVAESPNKTDIKYSVLPKLSTIEETFAPLMEEVWRARVNVDKTITFCLTYDNVTFKSRLGKGKTEPPGLPDLACFHIVDMFTACTHVEVKNSIIDSFRNPSSHLRIIVATVAFSMGLDCPNVRRIIHWGPLMIWSLTSKKQEEQEETGMQLQLSCTMVVRTLQEWK